MFGESGDLVSRIWMGIAYIYLHSPSDRGEVAFTV